MLHGPQLRRRAQVWLGLGLLVLAGNGACARADDAPPRELILKEALVIPPVGSYGRSPFHIDRLEAAIVCGNWQPPKVGDKIERPKGEPVVWEKVAADKEGWLTHKSLQGGYAYWAVLAESPGPWVLEA